MEFIIGFLMISTKNWCDQPERSMFNQQIFVPVTSEEWFKKKTPQQ